MDKVHCALGLRLLQLLAQPSVWAGSAWAGSPLPEAGKLRPARYKRPSLPQRFGPAEEAGEGKSLLPDAGGSPVKSDRTTAGAGEETAVAHAREEEEPNLGFCTEGGSPVWARGGGELGGRESSGEGSEGRSSVRKERSVRYPRARWCSGR
jgi:hypothetical protein